MIENMVGKKYGRLTITKQYYEKVSSGEQRDFCDADCECGGNKVHVLGKNIRKNMTLSCGCLHREAVYNACHKVNGYYLLDEQTMIGIDDKNEEFWFSPHRYDEIKDMCWNVGNHGYAETGINGKTIFLHNFLMKAENVRTVDHQNRNRRDNRDGNLRFSTIQENNINREIASNNTSGVMGVSEYQSGKWHSYLLNPITHKRINLYSDNFEDAVYKRLMLEKEFHGDFAAQRHLFSQYGIE